VALPQAYRLRRRADFSRVYKSGLRRTSPHLILRALRLPAKKSDPAQAIEAQPTLIGVSIGLKVSKRAVVRNRIKRQIRAALQQMLPEVADGWHLVVVVKPSAVECDYKQFLQELKQLLVSAEVIHGHSGRSLL
jgi:ribonuclease P protein component